jgi:hypothetical protein
MEEVALVKSQKELQGLQKNSATTLQLTPNENQMLAAKYKSKRIELMGESEITKWAKALLMKIHVITGWVIPSDGALYTILKDQFQKKITEDYGELNPDEIEFAFRSKGTTIEDWGKEMNLNLIDKILLPYLHDRYQLSNTEEKLHEQATRKEYDLKTSVDWRGQVEDNYNHFICNSKYFRRKMHPFEYEQLEQDGFIEKGAYRLRFKMYQKRLLKPDAQLVELAKERTLLQLFRLARKAQYKNLYVK